MRITIIPHLLTLATQLACKPNGDGGTTVITVHTTDDTVITVPTEDLGTHSTSTESGTGSTAAILTTTGTISTDATSDNESSGEKDECAAACLRLDECSNPIPGCDDYCAHTIAAYTYVGEGCLALFYDFQVCVAAATCDALANPPYCWEEQEATSSETCVTERCSIYCAHLVACGVNVPEQELMCGTSCSYALGEASDTPGKACLDASEALIDCQAGLECNQLNPLVGCEVEESAQMMACG